MPRYLFLDLQSKVSHYINVLYVKLLIKALLFLAEMEYRGLYVSSNGTVNATFSIPGLITIPSDGQAHNVTIAQLELEASLSWIAVPKLDTKTRLNVSYPISFLECIQNRHFTLQAKIKNSSEYTLLNGTASVYVDGSFIAKSRVPAVSPQESFDCPLG